MHPRIGSDAAEPPERLSRDRAFMTVATARYWDVTGFLSSDKV